ncbi:alpha-galactosidase [Cohnella hongkongensis]|uniref:Alpha-galactosidase n=1 Tax=Cohnella hongkongensis TaxID=178337 RepID=A0ABV9F9D5_9BACL
MNNSTVILNNWLKQALPSDLQELLSFDFVPAGREQEAEWDLLQADMAGERSLKLALTSRRTEAVVELRRQTDHVLEIQTTLRGISPEPDEWQLIYPLRLIWASDRMISRAVSGGTDEDYYPPLAFTEFTRTGTFSRTNRQIASPVALSSAPDGRSSNRDLPFLLSAVPGAGVVSGLEWSGLWRQQLSYVPELGVHENEFVIPVDGLKLQPDELLALPTVHLVFYEGDADDGCNSFRRYVLEHIVPSCDRQPKLPTVSYDTWAGINNEFDIDFLKRQALRCAELGMEYFVLDAGWFRESFDKGVGNWYSVDESKFPEGIEPLSAFVRNLGMKMGFWLELERAHRESDICRERPEWFLTAEHVPRLMHQEYRHLNLAMSDAVDWAIETTAFWIEKLDLKWIRFDYNIEPMEYFRRADRSGKLMFRYVEGLYRMFDRLKERYPHVLFEACASGGRRIDLGILRRCHTAWISDHSFDPNICRYIQSGASRFLPGNLLNSAVTVLKIGAGDDCFGDLDFVSRMLGTFSINGDVASWSKELTARAARLIERYKEWRWLLVENFYPLTSSPGRADQPDIVQFADRAGRNSIVFGFVAEGDVSLRVRMKGLDASRAYRVTDPLTDGSETTDGAELAFRGLKVELRGGFAFVRLFHAV